MKKVIFDSYCIIAYFEKDSGYEKVVDYFKDAVNNEVELIISIVNWGEVYYIILREQGIEKALEFERLFQKLPIKIADIDVELTKIAARFKAFKKLSYADCFAAATAAVRKGELVTGDNEFKEVVKEVKISWI